MTTWYTSDLHFYHSNVIQYCKRPYNSVEEMNEKLVANWNSVVHPDDTVYCLGDFSLAFRPVELYTKRLMGNKKLVPGNHDWCHPCNKKSKTPEKLAAVKAKYEAEGWEVLPIHYQLNLEGCANVNVCHLPYKGDNTDGRHERYRLPDDGRVLLCGHVHEKWQTKFTPKGTLMVNVGCDVWNWKPVHEDTLKALILSELKKQSSEKANS